MPVARKPLNMTRRHQHRMTPGWRGPSRASRSLWRQPHVAPPCGWVSGGRRSASRPMRTGTASPPAPPAAETQAGPRNLKLRGPVPRY